jgi:3-dehydroquinate dehydratase-2
MNVLVLHGPNLNLLGEREPELYGTLSFAKLEALISRRGIELGFSLKFFQSNHEGALIDRIHEERKWMHALLINAGALTHYSYALRDAIAAVKTRAIEVHLTDLSKRESWRQVSVLAEVCEAQIMGKGPQGYVEALEKLRK